MDFTKKLCAIERRKGDFIIYPTKYIYFKHVKKGFVPIADSTGPFEQLFAMNENLKPMPIERIIQCSDNVIELKQSLKKTNKRIKLRKNLSIARNTVETETEKKKRLLLLEKQQAAENRKKLTNATNQVIVNADSHFYNYVKKSHRNTRSRNEKNNEVPDKEINKEPNIIIDEHSQNFLGDTSSVGSDCNSISSREESEDGSEQILDNTLRISQENFTPSRASTPVSQVNSPKNQQDLNNNDNNIISEDHSRDVIENSDVEVHDLNQQRVEQQPRQLFFENLWPENNHLQSNNGNTFININLVDLKQCMKEFGEHLMTNLINHQKNNDHEARNAEFELPPVQNNKIKVSGFELDSDEIFKAKDAISMRTCANHVIRAYWPLETRKKLVLSKRAGQPDDRVQVENKDIHNLKKICKILQRNRTFDITKKENKLSNMKIWIEEILKNDRRPQKTAEELNRIKQKAKLRRQEKKRLERERRDQEGGTTT
ncbi:uncharacterized protein LOC130674501 [Microplitis mediator]|uniref:uncharacterized protein LOC130674501 n=1 Tax=Microplitis mediator TaxID=375433 RepID=UPI0025523C34|nr:uncharacterized protein LOC130674501 [Microplitis mediator]